MKQLIMTIIVLGLGLIGCSTLMSPSQSQIEALRKEKESAEERRLEIQREQEERRSIQARLEEERRIKKEEEEDRDRIRRSVSMNGFKEMNGCEEKFGEGKCIKGYLGYPEEGVKIESCYMEIPRDNYNRYGKFTDEALPQLCFTEFEHNQQKKLAAAEKRQRDRFLSQKKQDCANLKKNNPAGYDNALLTGYCD